MPSKGKRGRSENSSNAESLSNEDIFELGAEYMFGDTLQSGFFDIKDLQNNFLNFASVANREKYYINGAPNKDFIRDYSHGMSYIMRKGENKSMKIFWKKFDQINTDDFWQRAGFIENPNNIRKISKMKFKEFKNVRNKKKHRNFRFFEIGENPAGWNRWDFSPQPINASEFINKSNAQNLSVECEKSISLSVFQQPEELFEDSTSVKANFEIDDEIELQRLQDIEPIGYEVNDFEFNQSDDNEGFLSYSIEHFQNFDKDTLNLERGIPFSLFTDNPQS